MNNKHQEAIAILEAEIDRLERTSPSATDFSVLGSMKRATAIKDSVRKLEGE